MMTNKKQDKEGIPWETKKTVDMKIYEADEADAKWFKQWCDRKGIKFNVGMKLIRYIVEHNRIINSISQNVEDNRKQIQSLTTKLKSEENKEDKKKKPKTFGSNNGN